MVITPLDKDDIIALLLDHVVHGIPQTTAVFDNNFIDWNLRSKDSYEEAVVSSACGVHGEGVPAVKASGFKSGAVS